LGLDDLWQSLYQSIVNFDITWVAIKAIRNKKKGAWIIATGAISCLVFWLIFTLRFLDYSLISRHFMTLASLCIPVAVSIYLGYDFALTNVSLQQKLTEVENLSYEKQQILAAQNETLEQQVRPRTSALNQSLEELESYTGTTGSKRKDGFAWRTNSRHCSGDTKPLEFCK
jgi:hypothetical protein